MAKNSLGNMYMPQFSAGTGEVGRICERVSLACQIEGTTASNCIGQGRFRGRQSGGACAPHMAGGFLIASDWIGLWRPRTTSAHGTSQARPINAIT